MDMPVKAQVECLDGICGQSTCLIINPATRFVTHVVVEDKDDPEAQYLVPLAEIKLSTPQLIQLRCTQFELRKMPRFVHAHHERRAMPVTLYPFTEYTMGATMMIEEDEVPVLQQQVPEGELAMHQGAQVKATDGHIGQLDEFLLDPTTEQIDYLVVRERQLWHQKELTIPATQIERITDDAIYLKSDKQTIEHLQDAPAR
jgi:sporulation protein YlmC with PRC-barrel domain